MQLGVLQGGTRFTFLLDRAGRGDRLAANLVYQLAYPRLRKIAAALLARHRSHQTLQPTALVSELFLKLRLLPVTLQNRHHFFRLCSRAMGQVLTDRSRSSAAKVTRVSSLLDSMQAAGQTLDHETACAVRQLLVRFAKIDPHASAVLRLHFIGGYTWDEIAKRTGRKVWQVRGDSDFALDWMRRHFIQ